MNEERIVKQFMDYARIDSPSFHEGAFAEVLMRDLRDAGCEVIRDEAAVTVGSDTGNIIAYKKGTLPGEPIMFCAHMDAVTPCVGIEPYIDEDNILRSRGETVLSGDDKAGVTAIIEALRYVNEHGLPHRDLEIVFTICEEVGLLGSNALDYSRIHAKTAYVLDGDGHAGTVTVKSPAHGFIETEFIGLAKHAGLEPENGISAIQMAADAITKMSLLRIDPETSANVGTIHGGAANNIVAESCKVTFEARSLDNEKVKRQMQHMLDIIDASAKAFGGSHKTKSYIEYPAIALDENEPVLARLREACEVAGFEYRPESSGGGADASNLYQHGISAATLGVGMSEVHSVNEYLAVKDLVESTGLVVTLMTLN